MTQCNWDRIEDIYHAASGLPASERSAFVENACAGDGDCIEKVNSLLEAAAHASLLDEPVSRWGATGDLVGTTVAGRYKIESELPHGAMGKVYVARHLELPNKLVVIKVLPQTPTEDRDAVIRFKREIEALTLIDHPGIVSVFGAGELDDGRPYVAMQYIDGLTLRSEISSEGMDPKRAASLIKQIGAAVGHVHDKGILHRDLKPENIMLQVLSDGTEVVKVVDFGIAKIKDSVAASGAINTVAIGTRAYMSPEQLHSGETLTAASDVYSMAVVACEIITGKRPAHPDPARGKWRPARVVLPPGIPAKAHNVIAKALSLDPTKRYQSAKQFGDDLAEALLQSQVTVPTRFQWPALARKLLVAGGVLILGLVCYEIYKYIAEPGPIPPAESKGFNYWITVQRMRDGQEYLDPYKSNGNDIFDSGDKFQLNVRTLDGGYLYIFNEGPPEPNTHSFRMIYPKPTINSGSASIGANQTVQSDWITFRGPAGSENFWIVWSVSPVTELELARNEAFKNAQAGLTNESLAAVKEYLKSMDAKVNARASRMTAAQEVQVRKRSDLVLTPAEIKHR